MRRFQHVDVRHAEAAGEALQAYADENADEIAEAHVETEAPRYGYGRSFIGVITAAMLVALFAFTGSWSATSPWFQAGSADAPAVQDRPAGSAGQDTERHRRCRTIQGIFKQAHGGIAH